MMNVASQPQTGLDSTDNHRLRPTRSSRSTDGQERRETASYAHPSGDTNDGQNPTESPSPEGSRGTDDDLDNPPNGGDGIGTTAAVRRFRTLVESLPDAAVVVFDDQLRCRAASGELFERCDVDPGGLEGASLDTHWLVDRSPEIGQACRNALAGESTAIGFAATDQYVRIRTAPVTTNDGTISEGMLVVREVSEQLGGLDESKEVTAPPDHEISTLVHDLKEPLRSVSGHLDLLEQRYNEEFEQDGTELLEYATDGASRMREIIEDIRSTDESVDSGPSRVDLDSVFGQSIADLQRKISQSDATVTADTLPDVCGDESKLTRLFVNLIDNGIKYSGASAPSIHLSAECTGDEWIVSVEDEGVGIAPDEQDSIFEFDERGGDTGDIPGTGTGLALCDEIVEQHDGRIWVESTPGEGSTFSVAMPVLT